MGVETIKYAKGEILEFQERYLQKVKEDVINGALFGSGVYDRDENGAIIVPCMLTFKDSTENNKTKNIKLNRI